MLFVIFSGILWVWYDFAVAPETELEKALADGAAGNIPQKIRAADMYMICYDFYRMDAKVLERENWSKLRTLGFLTRCSSKTVEAGGKLLEEAAATGDVEAAYRLALATRAAHDNRYFEWMKVAAEKGHKLAQESLAYHYTRMKPPNYKEALFWLEISNDNFSEVWKKNRYDSARNGLTDKEKSDVMKRVNEWTDAHTTSNK